MLIFLKKLDKFPLPPYIHRKPIDLDKKRYQTVFSEVVGSVAAPTAGFHFTPDIIQSIKHKGIEFVKITLHIGSGTFAPLKSDNVIEHNMHYEQVIISKEFIKH